MEVVNLELDSVDVGKLINIVLSILPHCSLDIFRSGMVIIKLPSKYGTIVAYVTEQEGYVRYDVKVDSETTYRYTYKHFYENEDTNSLIDTFIHLVRFRDLFNKGNEKEKEQERLAIEQFNSNLEKLKGYSKL